MPDPLLIGVLTEAPYRVVDGRVTWPESAYAHLGPLLAPEEATLCLFSPSEWKPTGEGLRAWRWNHDAGVWERKRMPFPDVVYNRIARRKTERAPSCRRLLTQIGERAPLFNPRFLDKGEVHRALQAPEVAGLWPRTHLCRNPLEGIAALDDLGDAYLKPIHGALGRNIVRLIRRGDGYDYARLRSGPQPPVMGYCPRREIRSFLRACFPDEPYLAQQTVVKSEYEGAPFDLRVLMQKEPDGRWSMSGAAGRVAAACEITTHATRRGQRVSWQRLADSGVDLPPRDGLEEACALALVTLERSLGLHFFEASLDVAVCRGRPYILEINSKPFPFDEEEIRAEAAGRLLRYARAVSRRRTNRA